MNKKREMWVSKIPALDLSGIYPPSSDRERLKVAKNLAEEHDLPQPTKELGYGSKATIYNTTDPTIILRISNDDVYNECEQIINMPEMQKTGGVNVMKKLIRHRGLLFSWKEKVDTNWYSILTKKYKDDRKKKAVITKLQNSYDFKQNEDLKQVLSELLTMPETYRFVKAIIKGVPTQDLHRENYGISLPDSKYPNSLQIIDC